METFTNHDSSSEDEDETLDPEVEAMLYSKIHHEDSTLEEPEEDLMQQIIRAKSPGFKRTADSGFCSLKGSVNSSPTQAASDEEEESRLTQITKHSTPRIINLIEDESSDDDEGIKILGDSDSEVEIIGETPSVKRERVTITQSLQTKDVPKYIADFETSSSEEDDDDHKDDENKVNCDINLNVTKPANFRSLKEIIGKDDQVRNEILDKPEKWTEGMRAFYNDVDYRLADITMEDIFQDMPDDPEMWKIDLEDRTISTLQPSRYFKKRVRCLNCDEFGHLARHCSRPKRSIRCYMCGTDGHSHTRCPESMCLRCGNPSSIYSNNCFHCRKLNKLVCEMCLGRGHVRNKCPDLWRRYHVTTESGLITSSIEGFKDPIYNWCCNCAKRGHYIHRCTAYAYSAYPYPVLGIHSYDEANDVQGLSSRERKRKIRMSKHVNVGALQRAFITSSNEEMSSSRLRWRERQKLRKEEKRKKKKQKKDTAEMSLKKKNNKKKQARSTIQDSIKMMKAESGGKIPVRKEAKIRNRMKKMKMSGPPSNHPVKRSERKKVVKLLRK